MKREMVFAMFCCCLMFCAHSLEAADAVFWPTFRGPDNTGVAPDADPPVSWSESENIKWKIELSGQGLSSPVIWKDKIFFLTAVPVQTMGEEKATPPEQAQNQPEGDRQGRRRGRMSRKASSPQKFDVVCLDRKSGKLLWQKTVKEGLPHEGHHGDASFASYSPVTDGKLIWASFGSNGLYCLDTDGNLKWSRELVKQRVRNGFGEGSSPAIAEKAVIVLADMKTSHISMHSTKSAVSRFGKTSVMRKLLGQAQLRLMLTDRFR